MKKAQDALRSQLDRLLYQLDTRILEKEEDLVRVKKQREELGVELYGRQQDLAKSQMKLEQLFEKFNDSQHIRKESELGLDDLRNENKDMKLHVKNQDKKFLKSQKELDELNQSLRHVCGRYVMFFLNVCFFWE